VLEGDQIEDALALPEIVLGRAHERRQEALEEDDDAAEESAVAPDGETSILRPEPPPGVEIPGRLAEELVDGRRAAGPLAAALPGLAVAHEAATTSTASSAITSLWRSTRTTWSPRVLMPPARSIRRRSISIPFSARASAISLAVTEP